MEYCEVKVNCHIYPTVVVLNSEIEILSLPSETNPDVHKYLTEDPEYKHPTLFPSISNAPPHFKQ